MEKYIYRSEKGSMLIGVLIVFLIISTVSVAMINRSFQGSILTTDSKKGYIAYQNSDQNTESFLNTLKTLDNAGTGNKIPENTNALGFCLGFICSDFNSILITPFSKVSELGSVQATGTNQSTSRSIKASVPRRIDGQLSTTLLDINNCDGTNICPLPSSTNSYNACDISVKVNIPSPSPSPDIENYEVRKSTNKNLAYGADPLETYGWQKVSSTETGGYFSSPAFFVLKNGDASVSGGNNGSQSGGQYSINSIYNAYFFTVKARNKKPFTLDSLYLAEPSGDVVNSVIIDNSPKCTGVSSDGQVALDHLNCVPLSRQPVGTETFKDKYNCCNGTECYQPSLNWKEDPQHDCALQQCLPSDEISLYPNGTPTTGYCGTVQACQNGRRCAPKEPYKTIAYCATVPPQSAKETGIVSTVWSLQQSQDVYMSPSSSKSSYPNPVDVSSPPGRPRCTRHECPPVAQVVAGNHTAYCGPLPDFGSTWDTTQTSCTTANCGEYTLGKSCALTCSSSPQVFHPFGPVSPDYPNGTSCSEQCPTGPSFQNPRTGSNLGLCNDTLPTPGGRSWTNKSSCVSFTKTATPTADGYTVTKACSLNCNTNYTVSNETHFPGSNQTPAACCTQNCIEGTTWTNPGCPTAPLNGYYTNGYSCKPNNCSDVTVIGSCIMKCDQYHHINGTTCEYDYVAGVSCGSKDTNSSWSSYGSTYTQVWISPYSWNNSPEKTWDGYWSTNSAHIGTDTCGYTCNATYHSENGVSCVSNTRSCGTAPANATWDSPNETWNGTAWSGCTSSCVANFHKENGSCVSDTRLVSCTGLPTGSSWNGPTTYTQTRVYTYLWYWGWYWTWSPDLIVAHLGADTCGYKTP